MEHRVEPDVDDWIVEAVGVAEPEQSCVETAREADLRVFAQRPDEHDQEEGKPAYRERFHYDAQRLGALAIVRRRNSIQSRLHRTAALMETLAGIRTLSGCTVSLFYVFTRTARDVVAGLPEAGVEFRQTDVVGPCPPGPNFGPSTWSRTPVVSSRPGLRHRQPATDRVYTAVDEGHQDQRNVEHTDCGVHLVTKILVAPSFNAIGFPDNERRHADDGSSTQTAKIIIAMRSGVRLAAYTGAGV